MDALARECFEEVGITIDFDFHPLYLGGYQRNNARDRRINDNYSAFVVRAASKTFKVDEVEVKVSKRPNLRPRNLKLEQLVCLIPSSRSVTCL